jgi:hypothetical protein
VVSAVIGITMATFITLSSLSLGLSAINTLQIRDAAIQASQRSALAENNSQHRYLMELLEQRLPQLAEYRVEQLGESGFRVVTSLPGLGMLPGFSQVEVVAVATNELL